MELKSARSVAQTHLVFQQWFTQYTRMDASKITPRFADSVHAQVEQLFADLYSSNPPQAARAPTSPGHEPRPDPHLTERASPPPPRAQALQTPVARKDLDADEQKPDVDQLQRHLLEDHQGPADSRVAPNPPAHEDPRVAQPAHAPPSAPVSPAHPRPASQLFIKQEPSDAHDAPASSRPRPHGPPAAAARTEPPAPESADEPGLVEEAPRPAPASKSRERRAAKRQPKHADTATAAAPVPASRHSRTPGSPQASRPSVEFEDNSVRAITRNAYKTILQQHAAQQQQKTDIQETIEVTSQIIVEKTEHIANQTDDTPKPATETAPNRHQHPTEDDLSSATINNPPAPSQQSPTEPSTTDEPTALPSSPEPHATSSTPSSPGSPEPTFSRLHDQAREKLQNMYGMTPPVSRVIYMTPSPALLTPDQQHRYYNTPLQPDNTALQPISSSDFFQYIASISLERNKAQRLLQAAANTAADPSETRPTSYSWFVLTDPKYRMAVALDPSKIFARANTPANRAKVDDLMTRLHARRWSARHSPAARAATSHAYTAQRKLARQSHLSDKQLAEAARSMSLLHPAPPPHEFLETEQPLLQAAEAAVFGPHRYARAQWMLQQANMQVRGGSDVALDTEPSRSSRDLRSRRLAKLQSQLYAHALMLHAAGPQAASLTAPGVYGTYGSRFGVFSELGRPQYSPLCYVEAKRHDFGPDESFDTLAEKEAAAQDGADTPAAPNRLDEEFPHLAQLPAIHRFPFLLANLPDGPARDAALADCEVMASVPFSSDSDAPEPAPDSGGGGESAAQVHAHREPMARETGAPGPSKRRKRDPVASAPPKPRRKPRRRKTHFY